MLSTASTFQLGSFGTNSTSSCCRTPVENVTNACFAVNVLPSASVTEIEVEDVVSTVLTVLERDS